MVLFGEIALEESEWALSMIKCILLEKVQFGCRLCMDGSARSRSQDGGSNV